MPRLFVSHFNHFPLSSPIQIFWIFQKMLEFARHAIFIIQIAALVLASKGAWYVAIAPLCTNTVVMIRTPCGFTPQAICLLEELAMLVKLIVGLARTNIIAQCAQMTNMRLMAIVRINRLIVLSCLYGWWCIALLSYIFIYCITCIS